MQGIIITIEKEELETIIYIAVEMALEKSRFLEEQEEPGDDVECIMKTPQLCNYLKMKISTLYQLTHKKEIPFNKKGKTLYFNKEKIDEWLSEGKSTTIYEQNRAREISITLADKRRNKSIA